MSTPVGSSQWMYSTPSGFYPYLIDQSLRFNDDDSPRLSLDPIGTPTLGTKCTISFWVKRAKLTASQYLFTGEQSNLYYDHLQFTGGGEDKILIVGQENASSYGYKTVAVFRDVGAWYHIVLECDSTQSTGTDRYKLYVNGVLQTLTSVYGAHPQNHAWYWNKSGNSQNIGRSEAYGNSFDGYMAEVNFIDGTALDATSFGETINGVWVPKAYDTADGAYGTNGFYLSFADSSAIGDDLSGNTNDFTANNLVASDVVPDSPTNNFATINAAHRHFNMTFKEGNLRHETSTNNRGVVGNFLLPKSGKWYWEHWSKSFHLASANEAHFVGINITDPNLDGSDRGGRNTGVSISSYDGSVFNESATGTSYGSGWAENQGVAVLFDADAATISFSENGGAFGSAVSIASGTTNKDWIPFVGMGGGTSNEVGVFNFGQDGTFAGETTSGNYTDANGIGNFKWEPPADALALCTANLPEVTIGPNSAEQADDYFNTAIWSGNSTSGRDIVTGHATDFVWIKSRSNATNHYLFDSIRGVNNQLLSNATSAEAVVSSNRMTAFNTDGFEVGDFAETNGTGKTFVGWSWKAGGTAVSNTDGSITSSVSAAPDAGFSIVSWVGNGTDGATVGHGLNSRVEAVILKDRDNGTNWNVKFKDMTSNQVCFLNTTDDDESPGSGYIGNFTADDTFTLVNGGSGITNVNRSGADIIAYCFHSSDVCKVGSYVGNGNADGTFVYTGFRPAFVLLKVSSAVNNWFIYDNKREGYNQENDTLSPNLSTVEDNSYKLDLVSNGFKIRGSNNAHNQSGQTFIYLAFAEAPFKYANAR